MAPNGNFWDYLIAGVVEFLNSFVGLLPMHEVSANLTAPTVGIAVPAVDVLYTVVKISGFNFLMIVAVVTIILALEAARWAYAAYMWVKRAIPMIG